MVSSTVELNRLLDIKIGVLKRTSKELESYREESSVQEKLVSVMRANHACCPHDLRKQIEVLQETNAMINPCTQRLLSAIRDFEDFMSRHKEDQAQLQTDKIETVQVILDRAKNLC